MLVYCVYVLMSTDILGCVGFYVDKLCAVGGERRRRRPRKRFC